MYLDKLRLDGRVAVVVGAGGGRMGTETSLALAEAGATVIGMDLSAERLAQTHEVVGAAGGAFVPMVVPRPADLRAHPAATPRPTVNEL